MIPWVNQRVEFGEVHQVCLHFQRTRDNARLDRSDTHTIPTVVNVRTCSQVFQANNILTAHWTLGKVSLAPLGVANGASYLQKANNVQGKAAQVGRHIYLCSSGPINNLTIPISSGRSNSGRVHRRPAPSTSWYYLSTQTSGHTPRNTAHGANAGTHVHAPCGVRTCTSGRSEYLKRKTNMLHSASSITASMLPLKKYVLVFYITLWGSLWPLRSYNSGWQVRVWKLLW